MYETRLRNPQTERLCKALLSLETEEECFRLLEDLCTIREVRDLAQRLEVALLLKQGLSYQKITEQVDVSTATIGRVSKCLNYGAGGYRATLKKLEDK